MHRNEMTWWTGICFILVMSVFLTAFEKKGLTTEQGLYSVDVQYAANPMKVGKNSVNVTIYDAKSGKPFGRKLVIEAIPWMPAHEHGSSDIPVVTYLGKGQYRIEGINFTMQGDWELYLKLRDGSKEDSAVFNVNVR